MGTRAAFYRNTHAWWNRFWLRHFPLSILDKPPNQGHEAIARLCSITEVSACSYPVAWRCVYTSCARYTVVRNNSERRWPAPTHGAAVGAPGAAHRGTHTAHCARSAVAPMMRYRKLKRMQVHGRVGLYKCVSRKGSRKAKTCEYSSRTSIQQTQLAEATQVCTALPRRRTSAQLDAFSQRLLQNAQSLPKSLLPSCPSCKTPCMPQGKRPCMHGHSPERCLQR
jgi:hypothetical protein